jgi:hypothetical protein
MKSMQQKKQDDNKKTIDSAVARVAGAVQVAGVAVSATMAIKDQALDDVEALKTESNAKAGDHAIKKITKDTKRVLGKSK